MMDPPKRLSRHWALEYSDGSLEYDVDPENPNLVLLVLYKSKAEAMAARLKIKETGVSPFPSVISITIS